MKKISILLIIISILLFNNISNAEDVIKNYMFYDEFDNLRASLGFFIEPNLFMGPNLSSKCRVKVDNYYYEVEKEDYSSADNYAFYWFIFKNAPVIKLNKATPVRGSIIYVLSRVVDVYEDSSKAKELLITAKVTDQYRYDVGRGVVEIIKEKNDLGKKLYTGTYALNVAFDQDFNVLGGVYETNGGYFIYSPWFDLKSYLSGTYSDRDGVTVTFGHYEQDNYSSNGPEPIEWYVVGKEENRYLLVSKYGLDTLPYHNAANVDSIDWEHSSLRKWLNEDFYSKAFSEAEKREIAAVKMKNPDSSNGWIKGGNDTTDRIFLLNTAEFQKYISENSVSAMCEATPYAKAHGAFVDKNELLTSPWWLRSSWDTVFPRGVIMSYYYTSIQDTNIVVRPALWVLVN